MVKIISKEGTKRKLFSELLKSREPVTVTVLAKRIKKTGRTVRSYLDEIEFEYKDHNLELVRKTNVGVYLNIDEKNRQKLLNSIQNEDINRGKDNNFSSDYRKLYILRTLLEDKFSYTIQLFADELFCSKGTIVSDLVNAQKWLEDHNLILKRRQNQGLWIEGNEADYRKALKDLFYEMQENDYTDDALAGDNEKLDYRIDEISYKKIKDLFPKIELYPIQNIIQEAEKKLGFYFTDHAFLNLIIHIAISIERIKNNKAMSVSKQYIKNLKEEREYSIAEWVVKELGKVFSIRFPEEETAHILMHMLGAKVQENYNPYENDNTIEKEDSIYVDIAKSIITLASEILNLDLTEDSGLLPRLVQHLRPTIMGLKYGLKLSNPMLERIKREYTSIFGAAWACSSIFEEKLDMKINEDEVGYIALHLALSVENIKSKMKDKVNTVIVCSSGIGTSQLVALKLSNKFKNLDITHILPLNLLNEKIIKQSDIIITTIRNVKYQDDKMVYVSTLIDENDLSNIEKAISRIQRNLKSRFNSILVDNSLEDPENNTFDSKLCFLDSKITDFTEAILYYGGMLEEMGYAKKGFCENILEREKKGSTYIGKGLAIPHALDIFVNKARICIVRFENPIAWQGNELELIIILCLKFNDIPTTKKVFKNLYSILENGELISKMKETESVSEMIDIFVKGGFRDEQHNK